MAEFMIDDMIEIEEAKLTCFDFLFLNLFFNFFLFN